jgi:transcription-repair coupling factor (superfamily II helicase)
MAAQAHLAWGLLETLQKPVVWVMDGPQSLDLFYQDLHTLAFDRSSRIGFFPAWEVLPGQGGTPRSDLIGERYQTLHAFLNESPPTVVATCIQALMQKTLAPETLEHAVVSLSVGDDFNREDLIEQLQRMGYVFDVQVYEKGQASARGGLLDVWSPHSENPVRLEFFGSTLESIRAFDPIDQGSVERSQQCALAPASEWHLPTNDGWLRGSLIDYLSSDSIWAWSDPVSIRQHAALYEEWIEQIHGDERAITHKHVQQAIERLGWTGMLTINDEPSEHTLDFSSCNGVPMIDPKSREPDRADAARRAFVERLIRAREDGCDVRLFFGSDGTRDRFKEWFHRLKFGRELEMRAGWLSEGFICEPIGLMVVAESDLYGQRKIRRSRSSLQQRSRRGAVGQAVRVDSLEDLQPGDAVVHVDYGVGQYLGLYEIDVQQQKQEVLAVEYADKAKLYVPMAHVHLLSRYVGMGGRPPRLHRLGGKRWQREKMATEEAIQDLASTLLETQAKRDALDGHAFSSDSTWQHEFEAAFPYQETPDQQAAIESVKQDMLHARPMDRLICGDVGYGKTEVAMRASFKAIMDGKQAAILVPTTILAQQHFDTFSARFAPFPVAIRMLSRFQTKGEQRQIIEQLAGGTVDLVIGTHRLIQDDVTFKDLGLVIIDEEQRFGVAQKERLKQLRELVDVLTLTATPIPRTLYMSLTGAKDMSAIQSPPRDRMPIETIITEQSDDVVRQAILREINREGQAFYLHNRVKTIESVRKNMAKIVPEARIGVAHGQMAEGELAAVMRRFIRGKLDVLLCTTIIESGVDIPNVNTILIDRADRFGLAELYQLRGRVGRYKHQAYAYLLLPKHGVLEHDARKRIGAIRKYGHLGAGYKLALKDLEIRGAGNILGSEQSGHIAAVGFDLYCQLLKRAVAGLKGDPAPPLIDTDIVLDFVEYTTSPDTTDNAAMLPADYPEDENLRIALYRKIAGAGTQEEVLALYEELSDRFGPLPDPVDRLLRLTRLRIKAAEKGVTRVEVQADKIMLTRNREYVKRNGRFPRLSPATTSEKIDQIIRVVEGLE